MKSKGRRGGNRERIVEHADKIQEKDQRTKKRKERLATNGRRTRMVDLEQGHCMNTYNSVEREIILSSSAQCITLTILQLRFDTQLMRLGQHPLPVKSYKSPSIDDRRFVNSRSRLAGSKSEIQQIRSQINLGAHIASVNDDKRRVYRRKFALQFNVTI